MNIFDKKEGSALQGAANLHHVQFTLKQTKNNEHQ
jgi:hypothetical protein